MAIEFECDRCGQDLKVPDDWGGRRVRCKGCNRVLTVPDPLVTQLDSSFDFEALHQDQDAEEEQLVTEFSPIPRASRRSREAKEDKFEVTCPHCKKVIRVQDPYIEVLCSSCWKPVPPLKKGEELTTSGPRKDDTGAYYDELMGVFSYPMGAIGSISLGMAVAGGAIALPISVILMFVMGVALNPIAERADISWVPWVLAGMFVVEGFYFAGMGYSAMLDSAGNTVAQNDKPPEVPWNLTTIGSGIVGYLTLVIVYGLAFVGLNYLLSGGKFVVPTSLEQATKLISPVSLLALAILTFTVPMAIVGLSLMPGLGGLSPGRIMRSIAATAVHYVFLFLAVCFVLAIYIGITSNVVAWAIEALMTVLRKGIEEGLGELAMGLLAWMALVGTGLYLALMMGRLHGLFARTFRARLAFT